MGTNPNGRHTPRNNAFSFYQPVPNPTGVNQGFGNGIPTFNSQNSTMPNSNGIGQNTNIPNYNGIGQNQNIPNYNGVGSNNVYTNGQNPGVTPLAQYAHNMRRQDPLRDPMTVSRA